MKLDGQYYFWQKLLYITTWLPTPTPTPMHYSLSATQYYREGIWVPIAGCEVGGGGVGVVGTGPDKADQPRQVMALKGSAFDPGV